MIYNKSTGRNGLCQNRRTQAILMVRTLACLAGASSAWAQTSELGVPSFGNAPISPYSSAYGNPFPEPYNPAANEPNNSSAELRDHGPRYDVALTRDLPYVPAISRPRRAYNLKMGDATMLFSGSLTGTYSDNALQGASGNQQDDFTVTPSLNMALDVPLTENNSFRLDVGVGYRYNFNFTELNSIYIAPRSVVDYRLRLGDVLVTFFDQLSTSADSMQRVDLQNSGTARGVDFSRLDNQAGLSVAYDLARETSLVGGYSFGINRGLSDSYSYFDSNTHNFNAAVYQRLSQRVTVGLASSYNINEFLETRSALSSSKGWSAGPVLSYRPSSFLNFSASVRYSSITYDKIGGISGASDPASVIFDVSATHQINRYLSHHLTGGRYFNSSLSSAQMETYTAEYGITWNVFRNLGISGSAGWQNFKQTGNSLTRLFPNRNDAIAALTGLPQRDGSLTTAAQAAAIYDFYSFQDSGDSFHFGIGTSYQFTRKLTGSLAYSHTLRSSSIQAGNRYGIAPEYNANTVSLNLGYRF